MFAAEEMDEPRSKKAEAMAPAMKPKTSSGARDMASGVEAEKQPAAITTGAGESETRRRIETGRQAYWRVAVTTGSNGKATLSVPLPEAIGAYRATVKGCSTETLVGQHERVIVVSKPLFVDLRAPSLLQEQDTVFLTGSLHNAGQFRGTVKAVLTLNSGDERRTFTKEVSLEPGQIEPLLFQAYTVPLATMVDISLDIMDEGRVLDSIVLSVPVRSWGLPFADQESGIAESDRTVFLELPDDKRYSARSMTIALEASVSQTLVDLVLRDRIAELWDGALQDFPFPSQAPSDLLALTSLVWYLEGRSHAAQDLLKAGGRTRAFVAELTATQSADGSWGYGGGGSEIEVTSLAHWALASAANRGIGVDSAVLDRSERFLRGRYAGLEQDDYELRAMILHALTHWGGADYAFVNRLYRMRSALSEAALAYTALCLAALDREDMGRELLALLDLSALHKPDGAERQLYWSGAKNMVWERNPVETTALALLAYEALEPQASSIPEAARFLLASLDRLGCRPAKAKGVVAAALTAYYTTRARIESDYTLEISVNGAPAGTMAAESGSERKILHIPRNLIREGRNSVSFRKQGQGQYFYTVSLTGFTKDLEHEPAWTSPEIRSKRFIHENLTYRGRTIGTSTMQISELESGRLATVRIRLRGRTGDRYLVLEDAIPAGATLLRDSVSGNYSYMQTAGGKVAFYFEPNRSLSTISYRIAGYAPGEYRVLPPVLKDALDPGQMIVGAPSQLKLLAPGETSSEPYRMNDGELFGLGKAYFDDTRKPEALELLETLYDRNKRYRKRDVARMLLWLRSEPELYDARKLVEYFEILKENTPDLFIPFDKILAVGRAYHDLGEFERAYLVYRATIEAGFYRDAPVGGALEQAGELVGSIEFMKRLWREYPDSPPVLEAYFALAQELYDKAPRSATITSRLSLSGSNKPAVLSQAELLNRAETMFWRFLSLYPRSPMSDDAAFSRINLSLDRKTYAHAVLLSREYHDRFPESDFATSFQYTEALGFFSMLRYNEAIEAARVVAEGESEDSELAIYILGQIYHSMQNPAVAVGYYNRVKNIFPDAGEAAQYFERRSLSMEEVTTFAPGDPVALTLRFRNLRQGHIQVYRVDLMKLYLKEKNLSRITRINLSGINPLVEKELTLGSDKDYRDREQAVPLDLSQEGAYLVICRGDDLFASGLVLITPLALEVQEDPGSGRVRVNVRDTQKGRYAGGVHVKVIGSRNTTFVSGETDPRGIFVADDIRGSATVIVRDRQSRFAFYRGVRAPESDEDEHYQQREYYDRPKADYRSNTLRRQEMMQQQNRKSLDSLYESDRSGVQIQEAY